MFVLLSVIIIIAFAFLFAFLEKSTILDDQVTFEKSRYSILYVLFCTLIILLPLFIIGLLRYDPRDSSWPEKHTWLNAYNMLSAALFIIGINTFLKRNKSGSLLLNLGKTRKNKQMFWFGLAIFSLATFNVSTLILGGSMPGEPYKSIFYFAWGFYIFALGISGLEFRENGIWFMCSLIEWNQMKSYIWDLDKVNILTVQLKPRFLSPPASMSLAIPEQYKDAVSQILNQHLPY